MAKDRASRRARLRQQTADDSGAIDKRRDSNVSFAEEYAYVLKDLRWVFALAAIMFVLLVVLNLVLQ
ncbi:MAG: hypothetical protein H6657_12010 [Ardenticatenaceae bacterium]|nr:hypothetical protein [Anaerolineales bacterium]MCB8978138.1 hypothetical protein [Ardenticatenaceae bacterium]